MKVKEKSFEIWKYGNAAALKEEFCFLGRIKTVEILNCYLGAIKKISTSKIQNVKPILLENPIFYNIIVNLTRMNEATPFKLLFKIFFRTKNEFHVCSIFVAFWILCFNEKVFLLLSETLLKAEEAMETTTTASTLNSSSVVSPKGRKMSFREKFKRFTSPTQNRKEINSGETESSSEGGRGDTPPRELKSQNYHKNASSR